MCLHITLTQESNSGPGRMATVSLPLNGQCQIVTAVGANIETNDSRTDGPLYKQYNIYTAPRYFLLSLASSGSVANVSTLAVWNLPSPITHFDVYKNSHLSLCIYSLWLQIIPYGHHLNKIFILSSFFESTLCNKGNVSRQSELICKQSLMYLQLIWSLNMG